MKQVTILGGLLAVSMVGSYLTWTAEDDDTKSTDVVALQATADSLQRIVWESEEDTIQITRASDKAGSWVQLEHTERRAVTPEPTEPADDVDPGEPADDADAAGSDDAQAEPEEPPAEPVIETTTTRFAGNDQANILWDSFAPLYALRELDTPATDALSSFGLETPEATLSVTVGNQTTKLDVGGASYGTRDRYVRLDDRVFLIDSKLLRSLQAANTRLVERRLHPLAEADLVSLSLTRGGDTRSWTHQNREDRQAQFWGNTDTPDKKDVNAATWIDKVLKLRIKGYVNEDNMPADTKPLFSYTVQGDDATWTIDVVYAETEAATEYYATSDFTRATTVLTRTVAQNAIADLDSLFDEDGSTEDATPDADESP